MAGRAAELLLVALLATALTAIIAITVLRAPSERVFGIAIVGRHHDPFTVMAQFEGAPRPAMYWQPFTDTPGGLIARITGGVAAYNWIVLLTFPLAAISAFLLARHLELSPAAATLAAMAYAFSPFHIAHAAYHPHIAQVQWIPLYLLALWRCLDRASIAASAFLVAATAAVALSNFYGGLIAAVITPVAMISYALSHRRSPTIWRNAGVTLGTLAAVAAAGMAYVFAFAPALFANRAAFAFPQADVARYSATAMSFLTPPVAHPLVGDAMQRTWEAAGVRDGLLEQQVFLGWTLIALALIAIGRQLTHRHDHAVMPVLISVAAMALLFAISPPAWIYNALPMFRSYARFGVVVQLMTALAAGIGFDILRRSGSRRWRMVAIAAVILLAGEYAVSPLAMSRDVKDGEVLAVAAPQPLIYTAAMAGFSPREHDASWSWRWMGPLAMWTIRSTSPTPIVVSLALELSAFHDPRHLQVQLDGRTIDALEIDQERRPYSIGPFVVTPGDHTLTFHPVEPAVIANTMLNNGDTRALSFAIGSWHWIGQERRESDVKK